MMAKRYRLYAFDLDGTLIENHLKDGPDGRLEPDPRYPYTEPKLRRGADSMIRVLARNMAEFAIITNQGGVAFGHNTEDESTLRIARTLALLNWFEGRPFSVHVCFTHPSATVEKYRAEDTRRKPGSDMLIEAIGAHGGWYGETLYCGDLETDRLCAEGARVDYFHPDDLMKNLGVGPRGQGRGTLKSGASSRPPSTKTSAPSA